MSSVPPGAPRPTTWRHATKLPALAECRSTRRASRCAESRPIPPSYDPDHLLITRLGALDNRWQLWQPAAGDFGWEVELQTMDGVPTDHASALARARRARDELDLPTIYRVGICRGPRVGRDDQPVPQVDAWRLLQRARARAIESAGQNASDAAIARRLAALRASHSTTCSASIRWAARPTRSVGRRTRSVERRIRSVRPMRRAPTAIASLEAGGVRLSTTSGRRRRERVRWKRAADDRWSRSSTPDVVRTAGFLTRSSRATPRSRTG